MARKTKEKNVRMWIARDRHTLELWLYKFKPIKFEGDYYYSDSSEDEDIDNCFQLGTSLFPEVTFENSPQEVEIKLVNNL